MPIVTWEDIYNFIKKREKITTKEVYEHFNHNYRNVTKKLRGLRNHDMIKIEDGVIRCR